MPPLERGPHSQVKQASVFSLAAILALAVLLFSCRVEQPPPNCLILMVDSLRPDHLGCYDYERETSPSIDRLAREGALFENAFSTTSWTLPAHAALFTSLFDSVHGTFVDGRRLNERRITLAELLRDAGYRTAGFYTGPYLSSRYGLDQGFETYENCSTAFTDGSLTDKDGVLKAHRESHRDISSPRLEERCLAWLEKNREEPFFLFLHFFDVHHDYIPPPPFDTMFDPGYDGEITPDNYHRNRAIHPNMPPRDLAHLVALYDGEIAHVDAHIGRIIARLEEWGVLDSTLVVCLSDHGEEFFEHGGKGHRQTLYDESVRIPLIFRYPGTIPPGTAPDGLVRIVDVMPTVLDLLGIPDTGESMGSSLRPHLAGGGRSLPVYCELHGPDIRLFSLRKRNDKVILDQRKEEAVLFDLGQDRRELEPLEALQPPEEDDLVKSLGQWIKRTARLGRELPRAEEQEFVRDADLDRQLRALGYLADDPDQPAPADGSASPDIESRRPGP